MCRRWKHISNYNSAVNGRVWINWNPRKVHVQYIAEHEHALLCELLQVRTGKSFLLLAVYALNTNDQRKSLWEFLNQKIVGSQLPILVGGDFNAILSIEDRYQVMRYIVQMWRTFFNVFRLVVYKKSELLGLTSHGQITKKELTRYTLI